MPSHHDHHVGEWIGIRPVVDHVVTFERQPAGAAPAASASPAGPVVTALIADWPADRLKAARDSGSLLEASEVAQVVMFMLTRPRGMTIRDVVLMPTHFDL